MQNNETSNGATNVHGGVVKPWTQDGYYVVEIIKVERGQNSGSASTGIARIVLELLAGSCIMLSPVPPGAPACRTGMSRAHR